MEGRNKDEQKVIDLQSPAGQCMIVKDTRRGLLHKIYWHDENFLANRFHRKIKSETDWFEGVIRHAPTVGSFYENLIRSTLKEFAPSNNKIGTGFVFDSSRNKHGKQIDVLVFDDTDRSVVYRSEEFVVVNPGSVISAIEVKKTLNASNLKDVVKSSFYSNLGSFSDSYKNIQKLRIFSFKLGCKKETICRALVESLEDCIRTLEVETDEGRGGVLPITYCSLPELYFLDEEFYITTDLVIGKDHSFCLDVRVVPAPGTGSIGQMLNSVVEENRKKIGPHEKSYLANPVRPIPETLNVEGRFYLIDVFSIFDLVAIFPSSLGYFESLEVDGAKPVSVQVPKGLDIDKYNNLEDFLKSSGSVFEFFKEDGAIIVKSKDL